MITSKEQSSKKPASRITLISIITNTCLSFLQITVALFSNSQALLADGFHTASDLLSDFIVLFAQHKSCKKADKYHQYGYARYENAASFVLGLVLVFVGIGMLYRTWLKISHPENIYTVHITALWMAIVALLCKEILFRYMLYNARRLDSSLLEANAWHARSDAASSLIVALGIIGNLAGYPIFDPLAALLVGLIILRMGSKIAWSALNELMDRALPDEVINSINQTLLAIPGVLSTHDLRSRLMGDKALIDVHIEVEAQISVTEGHYIACEAQRQVLIKNKISDILVHIDPPNEEKSMREGMPQRSDIKIIIDEFFAQETAVNYQIILNYLEDEIEIIIILLEHINDDKQKDLLTQIINKTKEPARIRLLYQLIEKTIN